MGCLQIFYTQYATHSFTKGIKHFFCHFFNNVDKKKISQSNQIRPSWFVVLFPYQPIWEVTKVNWMKSVKSSTQWLKTKVAVIVLHESGNYSAHQSSPSNTWLFFYFFFTILLRLMYDVSIEPLSQNRTKP